VKINTLGYLGFESPNHKEWESFGPEIFGLGLNEPGADGTVYLRMDDRHHRIALHPGSEDRLAYIGWELRDKKAFRDAIAEPRQEPRPEPRQEILRTAARLFQQQGYDATSMNDVAAALKLSKGGLYHHFESKDEILYHIMSHAMQITEDRVINVVRRLDAARADASGIDITEERLRTLIRLHIEVVLSPEDREITVMLHENHPLPPTLRRKINGRKKDYVHFVENLVTDIQRKRNSPASVTPRAAAFALLGMINWIYQWYKPDGDLNGDALVAQYTDIFFRGALA